MAIIGINYNETKPETYQSVRLVSGPSRIEKLFDSGDFIKDWYNCNKYITQSDLAETEEHFSNSSSVDHFIMDGAPFESAYLYFDENDEPVLRYEYSHEEPGLEFFVKKGDRPTLEQLKEYCKE